MKLDGESLSLQHVARSPSPSRRLVGGVSATGLKDRWDDNRSCLLNLPVPV